jgi:NAD(P)-dependent dehydrogenase (short-subunit alcohol dehydrogenase family)
MGDGQVPVAVITGASSGIGLAAACGLAKLGWHVIGVGRTAQRCEQAREAIEKAGAAAVDFFTADLSVMAEVEKLAAEVVGRVDAVQVLINNAGGMAAEKVVTVEGLEQNFAANHLGHFLLTQRLLPLLRARAAQTAPGTVRILNTSSDASEMIEGLPWDDLQLLENFTPGGAYCGSKLANVMFARGLAGHYGDEGIVAHAMHPGSVDSNFIEGAPESAQEYMRTLDLMPPEAGADTLLWLATAPEAGQANGGYYYERAPRTPNPLVNDAAAVQRLWDESLAILAGIGIDASAAPA